MSTFLAATVTTIWLVFHPAPASADLAMDLLQASDRARGGIEDHGLTWSSKVDTDDEGDSSSREFRIQAKGVDALAEAVAPPRNRGEIYLFNDRSMWFYKPSLKKPMPISSRQKLSGQTSNGDIASTHYARDYSASIEREETIDGEKFHVLLLKAKASNLTYDRIRYWVSDATRLARKAEFLTIDGAPFKVGELEYRNEVAINGKKTPFVSKMTITDAKFKENRSVIVYMDPKVINPPANVFDVNRLSR